MNIAFYILIAIAAIVVWLSFSHEFSNIGAWVMNKCNDVKDDIAEDTTNKNNINKENEK